MANILLLKFDEKVGRRLADLLQLRGHQVAIHLGDCSSLDVLLDHSQGIDLVIIEVSSADSLTRQYVGAVRAYREAHRPCPMLLCVSRFYRGAQFQLQLERDGGRVIYVS